MMRLNILLITAFFSLSSCRIAVQSSGKELYFRKDYTLLPNHSAFYKAHKRPMNFTAAMTVCKLEGAKLMVPKSKSEVEAAFNLINDPETKVIWVGIHDIYSEGVFVTVDGETNFYTEWMKGTPSDHYGRENCVEARKDLGYNDVTCGLNYVFVCKAPTEGLTQNEKCETHDTEYIFNASLGKCYKLHSHPMRWSEAFRICVGEESHLVVINSDAEADFLVEQMKRYPDDLPGDYNKKYFYVGFSDLMIPGEFLTIEGKALHETGYEKWAGGQPDNYQKAEHCGSVTRNATLNDLNCSSRAMFFCEHSLSDNNVLVQAQF